MKIEPEERPIISVNDFSDIHLFIINFAEKLCISSKYKDTPKSTKEILQRIADSEKGITAQQGLEEIILSKPIPRNDGFIKLYGSRS